jgi:hypothetical protein
MVNGRGLENVQMSEKTKEQKAAWLDGFNDALQRISSYAECITGETGVTCKWFAKNCQSFVPKPEFIIVERKG